MAHWIYKGNKYNQGVGISKKGGIGRDRAKREHATPFAIPCTGPNICSDGGFAK